MANPRVSIIEKVKQADGTWTNVAVKIPAGKPRSGGLYLKDQREGKFYLLWREGGRRIYHPAEGPLENAIRAKEQKEKYLASVAAGLKVEDSTGAGPRMIRTPENIANFQHAMKDFPLYLDALLLYLRIFVDSLVVLTRQLPGFEGNDVNGRSFRDQKKWFIEKMPDVDPEYAAILQSETNWFTTLAGDKPGHGLRNYVVHRMVRTQLFFVPGKTPDENQVKAFLYGGSDIRGVDLLPTIENMVKEFFVFAEYHDQMFSLLFQFENELPSAWLFPHI